MTKDQAAALRAPFAPEQIGKLPKPTKRDNAKGKCPECKGWHGLPAVHLDYVGHAAITDRFLQVDPLWTWEPMAVDPQGLPLRDASGGLWINLTLCGVTRPGYGDETNGKGMKEIIGDALRNGGMRFGVGLDLWSKEDLSASGTDIDDDGSAKANATRSSGASQRKPVGENNGERSATPTGSISDSQRRRLRAIQGEAGITDDQLKALVKSVAGVESSKDIPRAKYEALVTAVQAAKLQATA